VETKNVNRNELTTKFWAKDDIVTIKMFGESFVVKKYSVDYNDCATTKYSLFEPTHLKMPPKDDLIGRHIMLSDCLFSKDNICYDKSGSHYILPRGASSHPINSDANTIWREAQKIRVKEICNIVFPESQNGFSSYDGDIVEPHPSIISTHHLDKAKKDNISLSRFVGWKVKHDLFGTGTYCQLKEGVFAVKWRLQCSSPNCKKRIICYTMSGCTAGAFCYLCNKEGKYLGDLRNCGVVCNNH